MIWLRIEKGMAIRVAAWLMMTKNFFDNIADGIEGNLPKC